MSFFDRGKKTETRAPSAGPANKSEYSLFRRVSTPEEEKLAEPQRSLRIIRGKGALDEPSTTTDSLPSEGAGQAHSVRADDEPAKAAPSADAPRRMFSHSRPTPPTVLPTAMETPKQAEEPNANQASRSDTEPANGASPPAEQRSGGFLSRLARKPELVEAHVEPKLTTSSISSEAPADNTSSPLEQNTGETASSVTTSKKNGRRFLKLPLKSSKASLADKVEAIEKKAASTKVQRSKKTRGASAKKAHVYLQIDGSQREFFWTLTADGLDETPREEVSEAISFSKDDWAIRASKALSYKAAQDAALQEIGEPVHLVNRSKDLGYVYATREERPLTAGFRILPAQQALARLVKKEKALKDRPLITGFTLRNAEGHIAVAILYQVSPEGAISTPQVTLNPEKLDFVINEFSKQRRLNRKDVDSVLFDNAALLRELATLQAYPVENVWHGIPVSKIWRATAMASAFGAIVSCAWTGYGYVQLTAAKSSIQTLTRQQDSAKQKANRLISTSLYSFADALSIDQDHIFDTAQQLWLPGTQLKVEAKPDRTTYQVIVPVVTNKTFDNHPSVNATLPQQQVEAALRINVPQGCRKDTASVSGNMNEIEISVVCENRRSPLSGFRND